MAKAIQYLTGDRIPNTRLTYINEASRTNPKRRRALFICDCGNQIIRDLNWVRFLNITSCGCYKHEYLVEKNTIHNHAIRDNISGAYKSWQAMHQRVQVNPKYSNILICDRWFNFQSFFDDMGDRPDKHSIERKNNKGDYEPDNCIWVTQLTQAQNTDNVVNVIIGSETHSINEWCRIKGIGYHLIKQRRRRGMSIEDAITTPINKSKQGRLNK